MYAWIAPINVKTEDTKFGRILPQWPRNDSDVIKLPGKWDDMERDLPVEMPGISFPGLEREFYLPSDIIREIVPEFEPKTDVMEIRFPDLDRLPEVKVTTDEIKGDHHAAGTHTHYYLDIMA